MFHDCTLFSLQEKLKNRLIFLKGMFQIGYTGSLLVAILCTSEFLFSFLFYKKIIHIFVHERSLLHDYQSVISSKK